MEIQLSLIEISPKICDPKLGCPPLTVADYTISGRSRAGVGDLSFPIEQIRLDIGSGKFDTPAQQIRPIALRTEIKRQQQVGSIAPLSGCFLGANDQTRIGPISLSLRGSKRGDDLNIGGDCPSRLCGISPTGFA